ncbi:MAG: CAP domain-containing protein [Paludibacteraceae bacterium]|nr:CAP domain-containing protein [Paludibacteraceae bacterium]
MNSTKCIGVFLLLVFTSLTLNAEEWSSEEICKANTAATCPFLSKEEKNVILYNNLARLYPKKFARIEVSGETPRDSYVTTLENTLNTMTPVDPLTVHEGMTEAARCWAKESGEYGITGHDRRQCAPLSDYFKYGAYGENCSYGITTGRDIVLQLLVDRGVSSLGHRKNCLNGIYHSVGVAIDKHSTYRICCVMDFTSTTGISYLSDTPANIYSHNISTQTRVPSTNTTPTVTPPTNTPPTNTPPTNTPPTNTPPTKPTKEIDSHINTTTHTDITRSPEKHKTQWVRPFFDYSGRFALSYVGVGYRYAITDKSHWLNASLLSFRLWILGISPINLEAKVGSNERIFNYKPEMRLYFPVCKWLSLDPYGGCAVDIRHVYKALKSTYEFDQQTMQMGAFVGVALQFTNIRKMPFEIKADYSFPITNHQYHKGFSIGVQFYLGSFFP